MTNSDITPRPPKLLAVSMRSTSEATYREERDAVARDWFAFLKAALPGVLPLLLPNDAFYAAQLCDQPGVIGLLLTGGNDVGSCQERDDAEESSFRAIRSNGLPVLGICRGLQFLVHLHGGSLSACDAGLHRATRHRVDIVPPWQPASREVNSYHTIKAELAPDRELVPTATAPDGSLEALQHRTDPVYGIHWHPERETEPDPEDIALFRRIFLAGTSRSSGHALRQE